MQCSRILVPSYTGQGISLTPICPLVSLPWTLGYWGPNTSLLSFTSFRSPYHHPLASGPQTNVRPQEKKSARCCRFESRNNSEFIARNCAFYRPKLALVGQLHITCGISRLVVHPFSTLTILHIFHTYHRVSRPVVLGPVVPLYKYHI